MSKAITPHRWFPGWRASPPAAEVDAADYGTAFGLDLSLSPIEFEQPPAAPPGRQSARLGAAFGRALQTVGLSRPGGSARRPRR